MHHLSHVMKELYIYYANAEAKAKVRLSILQCVRTR